MSTENGIWLCQNCAKLVDNDPDRFTVELLRSWKRTAELCADEKLGKQQPFDQSSAPSICVARGGVEQEFLNGGTVGSEDVVAAVQSLLRPQLAESDGVHLLATAKGAANQPCAAIGVTRNNGWDWEVLFVAKGELGWELIAQTSFDGQKGSPPEVCYVPGAPGAPGALSITYIAGYGTGLYIRSTSWYRIARGTPKPLLTYPISFYVVGWGMPFDRKLTSAPVRSPSRLEQGAVLELEFTIDYWIAGSHADESGDSSLFSHTQSLALEWNSIGNSFVPRTSKDDFALITELWNQGTESFVAHYRPKLEALAKSDRAFQRKFSAKLLENYKR